MQTDVVLLAVDDDLDDAALAAAVQALAADVHRLLTRIACGGRARQDVALATLQRRIGVLLDRVDPHQSEGLHWRLESLRRRVTALQWLSDPRGDRPGRGGHGSSGLAA